MRIRSAPCSFGHRRHRRRGITIQEILVVLAVIMLLLALLVPSFSKTRERARRMICASNLREWGFAWQCYRDDYDDYLPTEGTYQGGGIYRRETWFNTLPAYLGLPAYVDIPGANDAIEEMPDMHVWICPSKNLTDAFKSGSGKNQFHYGMNQVLDGIGSGPEGSRDAPGFPDVKRLHVHTQAFRKKPFTVIMFDIADNSPAGTPRGVANMYQRGWYGERQGRFHGDYANVLYLNGAVGNCTADDLVTDRDFEHGDVIWNHPRLYWGYPPPGRR